MAIDVGDTVANLAILITADGTPTGTPVAAVDAVVATITLPDGTTTTPTVTTPSTGKYVVASFVTTQSGRHEIRWTCTNPNSASSDVFEVLGTDTNLLISLDQARRACGFPANVASVYDDDLRDLIASATAPMEDLCGALLAATHDETYSGGRRSICLRNTPIISVTSVVETAGAGYAKTLTAQAVDGSSFDTFGYSIDSLDAGEIVRRSAGVAIRFAAGIDNIRIVYVAGLATLPPHLVRATRLYVRDMFQSEANFNNARNPGNAPQMGITPNGIPVPTSVLVAIGGTNRTQALA